MIGKKNAKYFTIYDQANDVETWNGYRLFFINKDHLIQLFDVDFGETENSFSKGYRVVIKLNGEIAVSVTAD